MGTVLPKLWIFYPEDTENQAGVIATCYDLYVAQCTLW
jgi:hypothetical protein